MRNRHLPWNFFSGGGRRHRGMTMAESEKSGAGVQGREESEQV